MKTFLSAFLAIVPSLALFFSLPGSARGQMIPNGKDILRDALLSEASRSSDITVRKMGQVSSKDKFTPPVKITYVVKTDSVASVRLRYAADQIIFNWEEDKAQLRIDGGPANKKHVMGAGMIPPNKFVTIVQDVTPDKMTISVDGIQRASWSADFSKVNEQVRVFTIGAGVTIRGIYAEQLK